MKAIHDVTGGVAVEWGAWLCHSPGSVLCPGWPFQDSNPLVETQLLVIELQPDPERPRDPSHSQNHYLQETGGGELYFSQPPLGPFNRPFWHWAPWKRTPYYFGKNSPVLIQSSFLPVLFLQAHYPQVLPHLRHTKSHCTERFPRGGQQGIYSVTALKSQWAWGSCFMIENEYPSRSFYAPPPTSPQSCLFGRSLWMLSAFARCLISHPGVCSATTLLTLDSFNPIIKWSCCKFYN